MSIRVMTWAWSTALPPTPKLVLMALADIADDEGLCWPSHRTLATKCSVNERTVRRILAQLQEARLLSIEMRHRQDGSRTSNGYRLQAATDPPGQNVQGGGHPSPRGRVPTTRVGDTDVLARTTSEPSIETPPPIDSAVASGNVSAGGGEFEYPKKLHPAVRSALKNRLEAIPRDKAQEVLDELAGRMTIVEVRNPVRYCAALIARQRRSEFTPELGLAIAARRDRSVKNAMALEEAKATALRRYDGASLPHRLRTSIERMRSRKPLKSG